jgi:WhiB family redox-sensing transcriptional regulator
VPDVLGTAVPPGAQSWRWEWQESAPCRGHEDLFFHPPGEREPSRSERDAAARAMCRRCPVRRECAQHALLMREPYGVWGGLTEDDRSVQLYGPRPVRRR